VKPPLLKLCCAKQVISPVRLSRGRVESVVTLCQTTELTGKQTAYLLPGLCCAKQVIFPVSLSRKTVKSPLLKLCCAKQVIFPVRLSRGRVESAVALE
jgi:hypothetical protein